MPRRSLHRSHSDGCLTGEQHYWRRFSCSFWNLLISRLRDIDPPLPTWLPLLSRSTRPPDRLEPRTPPTPPACTHRHLEMSTWPKPKQNSPRIFARPRRLKRPRPSGNMYAPVSSTRGTTKTPSPSGMASRSNPSRRMRCKPLKPYTPFTRWCRKGTLLPWKRGSNTSAGWKGCRVVWVEMVYGAMRHWSRNTFSSWSPRWSSTGSIPSSMACLSMKNTSHSSRLTIRMRVSWRSGVGGGRAPYWPHSRLRNDLRTHDATGPDWQLSEADICPFSWRQQQWMQNSSFSAACARKLWNLQVYHEHAEGNAHHLGRYVVRPRIARPRALVHGAVPEDLTWPFAVPRIVPQ